MKTKYSSVIWVIIGIYISFHAYVIGVGKLSEPGPGLIFFLAGIVLIILSLLDLVQEVVYTKDVTTIRELWTDTKWQRVIVTLATAFAYIFLLEMFGFFVSTFLVMVVLFRVLEPSRWLITIMISLITSIISYVVFVVILKIPFP
jgi:putative tricarboxylic transport membrane protein